MSPPEDLRLPPGRQPYDPFNGLRVGGLAGAVVGGIVTALTSVGIAWVIPVGAALGGAVGFSWEKRRMAADRRRWEQGGPEGG